MGKGLLRRLTAARRGLATTSRPNLDGDAYAVLGVHPEASAKELKSAYRELARKWHPDVSKQPDALDVFPHITRSFELLSDEQQRPVYDCVRDLPGLKSPESFQAVYARALTLERFRLFQVVLRNGEGFARALAAAMTAAFVTLGWSRLTTAPAQQVPPSPPRPGAAPASAADVGGLLGGSASCYAMLSSGMRGPVGARWALGAAAAGALLGRGASRAAETQVGRLRLLGSPTVAWLVDNSRVLGEAAGAAAGAYLYRGSALRALRGGLLGAVGGHCVARVARQT